MLRARPDAIASSAFIRRLASVAAANAVARWAERYPGALRAQK
jgi:hypothetical protein